jgi:hypothetical protein
MSDLRTSVFSFRAGTATHEVGRGGSGLFAITPLKVRHDLPVEIMKRIAAWAFYAVGILAVLYLALYAYAVFTGRSFTPGDPVHIFRNPEAPNYS